MDCLSLNIFSKAANILCFWFTLFVINLSWISLHKDYQIYGSLPNSHQNLLWKVLWWSTVSTSFFELIRAELFTKIIDRAEQLDKLLRATCRAFKIFKYRNELNTAKNSQKYLVQQSSVKLYAQVQNWKFFDGRYAAFLLPLNSKENTKLVKFIWAKIQLHTFIRA